MVGVTAALWLLASQIVFFVPMRLLVTLVHEAGHALTAEVLGGDVLSVTVNRHGGGLMRSRSADPGTAYQVLVASAGYVGTALVGATMLELSRLLRGGRIALTALAAIIAAIGVAWVPWRFEPDPLAELATGSSSGDGRFTVLVCVVAVITLSGLAVQPLTRLRRAAVMVIATCLCLGAVEDLQILLDISRRGGHSDAALAAAVTPLSSWMWAAIWMLLGVAACVLATWSAAGREPPETGAAPTVA